MSENKVAQPLSPGIEIPSGETKVKVGAAAVATAKPGPAEILCKTGSICARGIAIPPGGEISLVTVHARIYRKENDVPPAEHPPSPAKDIALCDPLARVINTGGNLNWQFDDIPNAQCKDNAPGKSANFLGVWAVWSNGNKTRDVQQFDGVCDVKTDCEA